MYLIINGNKYSVSKRIVTNDSVKYHSVSPQPTELGDTIKMYRDDGFLLSTDNPADYSETSYTGTLLVLTNQTDTIYNTERTLAQRVAALEKSIMDGIGI